MRATLTALGMLALLAAALPGAGGAAECERTWTFPVPFYQSLAWSPDGKRLALAAVMKDWDTGYRLYLVGVDGSGLEEISTGDHGDLYPAWSPDGSRLAYASERDGNTDIYVMRPDGSEEVRLTDDPAKDSYPWWSPDGSWLAFHSNRDGDYEIYRMAPDGSDRRRLTRAPGDDYSPSWSPAGGRIAFEANRDGVEGDEVYLMDADGGRVSLLVDQGVFPTWSPDGKRLLYSAGHDLRSAAVDGSGSELVAEHAIYGVWSPDGSRVAAAVYELDEECKDHWSIDLLDAGGGRVKLLSGRPPEP